MLVPEDEYKRLIASRASNPEADLPPLPAKLPDGNYPAQAFGRSRRSTGR